MIVWLVKKMDVANELYARVHTRKMPNEKQTQIKAKRPKITPIRRVLVYSAALCAYNYNIFAISWTAKVELIGA